ncbi:hypothetical protein BGZ76_004211 [Entomortierella beljakovae]|nr:hypothetical protein BGZ76_004211 [Entomortierella beljakovae]
MTASPNPLPVASTGASSSSTPAISEQQSESWSGMRPDDGNTPAPAVKISNGQINSPVVTATPSTIQIPTSAINHHIFSSNNAHDDSMFPKLNAYGGVTGFKIRIPRDLPNIPAAFRKRGAIRSPPSSSPNARYSPLVPPSARPNPFDDESLVQTKLVVTQRDPTDTAKRTHDETLTEESRVPKNYLALEPRPGPEKRLKTMKPKINVTDHVRTSPTNTDNPPSVQANTTRENLTSSPTKTQVTADVVPKPVTLPSSSAYTISDNIKKEDLSDTTMNLRPKRHSSRVKSSTNSPSHTPTRFPTPTSIGGGTTGDLEEPLQEFNLPYLESVIHPNASKPNPIDATASTSHPIPDSDLDTGLVRDSSHPLKLSSSITLDGGVANAREPKISTDGDSTVIEKKELPPTQPSITPTPDPNLPTLTPIELVRLGTTILDRLLSNPICKDFVNQVPQSVANYHAIIKRPMDLMTIEQKLWKGVAMQPSYYEQLTPGAIIAAESYKMSSDGYSCLQDFERDLQRIYRNAVYFNPPQQIIHKEALSYDVLYKSLLLAFREQRLSPVASVPQEHYTPSSVGMSQPGPIYLFRLHQVSEMDRKMTDVSVDLFATFHQPILEIMYSSEPLSPEKPRFSRLYTNKNRSLLDTCRDSPNAKILIFSDLHVGKVFLEPSRITPGSTTRKVRIKARAMIVKPIGERHEMITVGDLDCPIAWITVACVSSFDWEVDVPAKFEKGVLSKIRHEVVPFGNSKISSEHLKPLLDSIGLQIPNFEPPVDIKTEPDQIENRFSLRNDQQPVSSMAFTSTEENTPTSSVASDTPSESSRKRAKPNETQATELMKPKVEEEDIYLKKSSELSVSKPLLSSSPSPAASSASDATSYASRTFERSSIQNSSHRSYGEKSSLNEIFPTSSVSSNSSTRALTMREQRMLRDLKAASYEMNVPYINWDSIEPTLTVDTAHGLFKRIYHVRGDDSLVVQNFKEMDSESFEQRVREVVCLLKLRGSDEIGQIQAVINDENDHLVGLSMTKYAYTLKAYATSARRHPSPRQKLSLIRDMVSAISAIHEAGLAHRDLSEVNIMVDEDPVLLLEDKSPKPYIRVIDFGKSVFVEPDEVRRWSVIEPVPEEAIKILPLVVLPPDHGYKLYRSILTLPRSKYDHAPLPPVDPRLEDVYSLGVLIWRTFSGKSPWNGAIEDDLKTIRYLVRSDTQIKFQLEREVKGPRSKELLLKCLTASAETRSTSHQLKAWLEQPEILVDLLNEFETLGGGRKRVRKNLD